MQILSSTRQELSVSTNTFDVITLTLESGILVQYFNFVDNILIVSARALIFLIQCLEHCIGIIGPMVT